MPLFVSPSSIYNHILLSLTKKSVILNFRHYCPHRLGYALLYYKTASLTPGYWHDYAHTNFWEIQELVKILNQLGFWVDIVDRGAPTSWLPKDKYRLFVGIGIDGSGHHYLRLADHVPSAIKVLYATSSSPHQRNQAIEQRYRDFSNRTGVSLPTYRTVQVDINRTAAITNHIICVGNSVTKATFDSFNRPLQKIYLSTSPRLYFDTPAFYLKQPDHFFFFAGSGNILKGLDLLLETFTQLPHLHLFVATVLEPEFTGHYGALLSRSPNIHILNFMQIASRRFYDITSRCAYVILPSCTEGCATSVTSCMRRGLVPVVTRQCGIDVDDFGFYIDDLSITGLSALVTRLASLPTDMLHERIAASYQSSCQFTQTAFSASFTHALLNILDLSV